MTGLRWRATVAAATVGVAAACAATAAAATPVPVPDQGGVALQPLVASHVNVRSPRAARIPIYSLCGPRAAAHGLLCYTPQVLQSAYGVAPLLTAKVTGAGETIVLPEVAYPRAYVRRLKPHSGIYLKQSVRAFDAVFHLPGVRLSTDTALAPGTAANRVPSAEEILDVEMAHAMAPSARIVVELVTGNLVKRLPAVIRVGARKGRLLSISYGIGESCLRHSLPSIQAALTAAEAKGESVFASSGDDLDMSRTCTTESTNGVVSLTMPASDPLITAVGGTQLSADQTSGAYLGETVWNQQEAAGGKGAPDGSGGGFSALFPTPGYQVGVPGITTQRGDPDVAFSASQTDGVEIVSFLEGSTCAKLHRLVGGRGSTRECVIAQGVGGTSVGSPAWAGIGALADQYAHHPLGLLNPAIYKVGESPSYGAAFHDVTAGNNSATFHGKPIPGYSAGPGWDPTTGWGTPNASVLVPLLAAGG